MGCDIDFNNVDVSDELVNGEMVFRYNKYR